MHICREYKLFYIVHAYCKKKYCTCCWWTLFYELHYCCQPYYNVLLTYTDYLVFGRDGMISKSEMKTYFIRANCHALRKCFKHDFHETTYFKPTFCIHCTGLVCVL